MITQALAGLAGTAAAAVATAVAVVAASGRYSPRVARAWRRAAQQLGWADDAVRIGVRGVELRAAEDQLRVSVTVKGRKGFAMRNPAVQGLRTAIIVDSALLPPDLELGPETAGARIAKVVRGGDLVTGDGSFDREVVVRGDRVVVAALLDRTTRVRVREAVRDGFRVAGGRLWGSVQGVVVDPLTLAAAVRRLRRLVGALTPRSDPVPRLAEIARFDPDPGVRRAVLHLLVERFRSRRETANSLRRALRDHDSRIRLDAALALGPDGETELRFLADRSDVSDEIRATAVAVLGDRLPPGRALELLDLALERNLLHLAGSLVDTLGTIGGEPARRRLVQVMHVCDPHLAARAARALGVAPGQLALAADECGRVALAGDTRGHVAVAAEEDAPPR